MESGPQTVGRDAVEPQRVHFRIVARIKYPSLGEFVAARQHLALPIHSGRSCYDRVVERFDLPLATIEVHEECLGMANPPHF